jgi:flavin reductase (DIM6/NTAB) family NADH-FMN oxidoreductase RutF
MPRQPAGDGHHDASSGSFSGAAGGAIAASLALEAMPRANWLLTASHADRRAGLLVESVIVCGKEPALICVAARKGHAIEPLIRDSHRFALCAIEASERVLLRRFLSIRSPEEPGDPFEGVGVQRLVTGAPLLACAKTALDCDVHRHVDIESDRQLYIGLVLGGRVNGHAIIPCEPPEFQQSQ